MLAGQITGRRRIEMIEMPIPEIEEGQILIKLEAGSICGSDLPFFLLDRSHPILAGVSIPLPPMLSLHELVGWVAHSRCRRFKEGDRVLALPANQHHGLAEYFVSTEESAVLIPRGPAHRFVVSQPLGTVIHCCLKLPNILGETAVVLGQGPAGQLFTALLRRLGVAQLIAVDLVPQRLLVSARMGATNTICGGATEVAEGVRLLTEGKGAGLVVEAVGLADTLNLAANLVRRNGTILAFGVPHRDSYDFAFRDLFYNEARIITSLGPNVQHDFGMAVEMIASGMIDVEPLVTHRFPFSRAEEGFTLFADRADGVVKVVLTSDQQE